MRVNKNACFCLLLFLAIACTPRNVVSVNTGAGLLRLEVVSPEIVRVSAASDGKFSDRQSLAVLPQEGCTDFEVSEAMGVVHLTTKALAMDIYKADGSMRFYDGEGNVLADDGRVSFDGGTAVSFASTDDEAFYGLGQHQAGELDHKGRREELYQYNTKISVPFVFSNKGYGILFDAYSYSRWGSTEPYRQLGEVFDLDLEGRYTTAGGKVLTQKEDSLYYENEWAIRNLPKSVPLNGAKVRYSGTITARETGDYHFMVRLTDKAGWQQIKAVSIKVVE